MEPGAIQRLSWKQAAERSSWKYFYNLENDRIHSVGPEVYGICACTFFWDCTSTDKLFVQGGRLETVSRFVVFVSFDYFSVNIWDNISCYRFYLPDYLPWILTTPATYLLKSVASITQKSMQPFKWIINN